MESTRLESTTLEERTQRKVEDDRKKEEARQRKEEARQRKEEEEKDRKKEEVRQQKEEAWQQKEEQAPKARGKYKTFDDRIEDLKRYKETHDHANVPIREDKSLAQFCAKARHARINSGKGKGKLLMLTH